MAAGDEGDPYRERSSVCRQGALLRVPLVDARLPERCVVCGQRFDVVQRKQILYRHGRPESTWWTIALLCTMWIAFLYLRPVFVQFWVCRAHLREHRRRLAWRWAAAGALFALTVAVALSGRRALGIWSMLAFAIAVGVARRASRLVRLADVEGEYAWLATHRDFVESFPEDVASALPARR